MPTREHELIEGLKRALHDKELFGERARMRQFFSPSLSYGRHSGPPHANSKPAAVMIFLEHRSGEWTIPLTVRPQHLPDHPGQISFPGGGLEAGEDHLSAAKREFAEELGVEPFPGEIIGEVTHTFVYNSNYHVVPFVAVCPEQLHYQPCPQEVERLIHLPVKRLLHADHESMSQFSRGNVNWQARVIDFDGDKVWGATAIMLGELAALLQNSDALQRSG